MENTFLDLLMETPELENKYITSRRIPLGTKKPPYYYYDEVTGKFVVPDRDIISCKLTKDQPFIGLNIGQPGCGKSVVNKRILYYVHKIGYKCAIFDYKGYEWIYSSLFGCPINLMPFEKEATLPIVSLVPSYRLKKLGPKILNFYREYAHNLTDIDDMRELISLGFTGSSSYDLFNAIDSGKFKNVKEILDFFKRKEKLHGAVREALAKRLIYLENVNFFKEDMGVTLSEFWSKGQIPNFSLFSAPKEDISFDFGKIIQKEYYTHKNVRRFILIDDGHKLIQKDMSTGEYMSAEAIIDYIYSLGRFKGWNMLLATQQPSFLNPEIISGATHIIFSRMGNLGDVVEKKINNPAIVSKINRLVYDKANHIMEKLIFYDDGGFDTFHQWGPITGHAWSGRHKKYKMF